MSAIAPRDTAPAVLPPKNTPGVLVYLCRNCHETMTAYPILDSNGTLTAIIRNYGQLTSLPTDPAKLPLAQWHGCADGTFGVADIVGMRVVGSGGGTA